MARIRTIKPEFFTSEDIVTMTPLARLFYVALWCEADREGRLDWRPGTLKMRYLPGDDCSIDDVAEQLIERGLLEIYEADGRVYGELPSFTRHQIINNRESESTRPPRVKHASTRVLAEGRKGRKGKEGKERKEDAQDAEQPPRKRSEGVSEDLFNTFWKTYPNKVGKDAARKAFDKRKPDQALVDSMIEALGVQSRSDAWTKNGGQFVPHPATWLNAGRWMDEVGVASTPMNVLFPGAI
jgi:hypothetical protein